jgi:hypothetical protein
VQRVAIDVAVDGHRANAHLFAGPDDSAGDLATISDQDLAEPSWTVSHKLINNLLLPIFNFQLASRRAFVQIGN